MFQLFLQSHQPFSWPFLDSFSLLHCSFFSSYHNLYPGLELVKEGVIKVKKNHTLFLIYQGGQNNKCKSEYPNELIQVVHNLNAHI